MSAEKKNIPKRRFKEFQNDEEWEKRELGDVAQYKNGKAHEENICTDGKYLVVNSKFVSTNGDVKKYTDKQIQPLFKDEIAFVLSDVPNGRAIARTFLVNESDRYSLNQRIAGITSSKDTYPYFLYILMNRNKYFLRFDDGAKQTNLSVDDVLKFESFYPVFEEQKKIGEFFKNCDNLITIHQHKLYKLKALKKAYLAQMFPLEAQSKPRLRFSGFNDDWEQRKVGDIGSIRTCKRIFKDQTQDVGDIPFFKNGTLGLTADAYISKDIYEEYKALYPFPKVGDVLMSVVGSIGRTAEYKGKDEYFQDSNIVWLDTDSKVVNKRFLQISYQIIDWIIEGSTIKHLYNDNILASKIWMPKLEEQKKIGELFYNLDNIITLHQRKLEKLQNIKKAYLNEMFV